MAETKESVACERCEAKEGQKVTVLVQRPGEVGCEVIIEMDLCKSCSLSLGEYLDEWIIDGQYS